ncbi:hypothetical protein ACLB1O_04800 [Escherichia coli]
MISSKNRCSLVSRKHRARYDQQKYDIFEKLIEKQLSFFWRPEEVDVSRDRIDCQALQPKTHLYQQPEISDAAGFHSGS